MPYYVSVMSGFITEQHILAIDRDLIARKMNKSASYVTLSFPR